MSKTAYFVVGAENSGNQMLGRSLASSGCYGTDEECLRMDEQNFDQYPKKIAFRRSIPHGAFIPDLRAIADRMRSAGYEVQPLYVYRKTDFFVAGQIARGYASNEDTALNNLQRAAVMAYDLAEYVQTPLIVVVYELFATMPQVRHAIFSKLGLSDPTWEVFNANEGRSLAGPILVW